eukprot:scaffold33591_cov18-Tisochrysis_lutea.AAC.2
MCLRACTCSVHLLVPVAADSFAVHSTARDANICTATNASGNSRNLGNEGARQQLATLGALLLDFRSFMTGSIDMVKTGTKQFNPVDWMHSPVELDFASWMDKGAAQLTPSSCFTVCSSCAFVHLCHPLRSSMSCSAKDDGWGPCFCLLCCALRICAFAHLQLMLRAHLRHLGFQAKNLLCLLLQEMCRLLLEVVDLPHALLLSRFYLLSSEGHGQGKQGPVSGFWHATKKLRCLLCQLKFFHCALPQQCWFVQHLHLIR